MSDFINEPKEYPEENQRYAALQTANSILILKRRAEEELLELKKKLEERTSELENSLSLLKATLDSTPNAIFAINQSNKIISYNTNFISMWKIPPELLRNGITSEILLNIKSQIKNPELLESIFTNQDSETFSLLELRDGRFFECYSIPQRVDTKVLGIVFTFVDITEHKQAHISLEKSEEQLRLALHGGDLGLWDWHFSTGQLEVNDRWMLMLGLNPKGQRPTIELWSSLIHSEDKVKLDKIVKEEILNPHGKNFEVEIRARHRDGHYIWILDKGAVVERDNAGNPIRISGTHIDITKSKESQEILHLREKSLGAISQGVVLTDTNRRITYINKAFEDITGYTEQEILGISCKFLQGLETDKSTLEKIRIAIENQIPIQIEIINYRKDGSKFWNELSISPVFDYTGKLIQFVGVQRDITSQKIAKLELIKAIEEAKAANQIKSDFLNNMSHEIRTPLNAVIGYTDLLLKSNLDEIQTQYLSRVASSANSLLGLLNDILDFSNIESGKIIIQSIPTNLSQLLEQILNELKLQTSKKDILVSYQISNDVPQFIISDQVKLKKIITNLISNAFKFTEQGEIECNITVNNYIPEENKVTLLFSVRDTGIGISEEDQSKIFVEFSQVDTSTSRKFGGTGLGLSISNQLLKLLQSKIEVKSELGKGSEFYFYLTANIESTSLNQNDISKDNIIYPVNTINYINPYKILVVDDDIINLELIKTIIKSILPNAILLDAANGKSAVEEYIKEKPNLIFLDIQMPEMSGYEAATKIRNLEDNNHIPIIAITAGIETGNKEKCFKSGMDDYANKPVTKIIIEQLLQKWLQKKNEMY